MKINHANVMDAAARTRNWPEGSQLHTDIYYDRTTGSVWTAIGYGSEYPSLSGRPNVFLVARTVRKTSANEIRQRICSAVAMDERCRAALKEQPAC